MQSNVEGVSLAINEADLGQMAMDILTLSEDVADVFSQVDSKMELLKNYFSGSEYDKLMNDYRTFRKNYSIVKEAIVSYSDDLIAVVNKARAGDTRIALLISDLTDETSKKAQKLENL